MNKKTICCWFFILLKLALHGWLINPLYDLHRDEYLHLDQARHLAWGYDSVPPFTSWISWLILQLGNGEFWVKFFPALAGALTVWVVWKIIETLKGNLFALSAGAIAVIFSAILRINMLFQPNSVDVLCWTLFYFTIVRYIATDKDKWLLWAGIVFAIGFLNKYNIVFLMLGILPALLLTPYRKILLRGALYIAVVIALVIISPNLYWQYQHHFVVFHHLKTLTATQLVNVNRIDFLKDQVLFFAGSIFILIAAFVAFFVYPPFYKYRLILLSFIFTLAIFIYFKAKDYYAIGLYPVLLAFGAVYLEKLLSTGWKFYLRPVAIAVVLLLFIPVVQVGFPIKSPEIIHQNGAQYKKYGLLRWEDGKDHAMPQDFADMLGWRELANKTDSAVSRIADTAHTIILCSNYGEAGAVNYYTRYKNIPAFCMEGDYYNWFVADHTEIKNIILVNIPGDTTKSLGEAAKIFTTILPVGKIENSYAREQGTSIYILKGAAAPALLKKKLVEDNKPE